MFAKLVYIDQDTEEPVQLGYDLSTKLYEELKLNNYIDKNGMVTPQLKEALENYKLNLSDEFHSWRLAIIKESDID